ncbi:MAG: hypothetical protein WCD53_29740, partial [Microcoleus sp.]
TVESGASPPFKIQLRHKISQRQQWSQVRRHPSRFNYDIKSHSDAPYSGVRCVATLQYSTTT